MTDITFPPIAPPSRWRINWTRPGIAEWCSRWLLLAAMLFALGWSIASTVDVGVDADASHDCDTVIGRLNEKVLSLLFSTSDKCESQQDTLPLGIP